MGASNGMEAGFVNAKAVREESFAMGIMGDMGGMGACLPRVPREQCAA